MEDSTKVKIKFNEINRNTENKCCSCAVIYNLAEAVVPLSKLKFKLRVS